MNKIKAAIIEDEIPAGRLLHKMLSGLKARLGYSCIARQHRGICKMVSGASTPGYNLSGYPTDRWHFFRFHRTGPTRKYDYFYHRLRRICHTCFYCKQHRLSAETNKQGKIGRSHRKV